VLMGDADDSYEFGHLSRYLEALDAGNNLVMGNRFRGGIQPGAMPPLHRYLGNPVLSLIGRVFFRVPARDFHCGLRAFRRDSILGLRLQTTGMEFASEMVVKAALMGLRIAEVPTTLKPDGRSRAPHLRTWRDGWRHLRFLLLYSPRWLFLYPGIAATFVGLATMLWLLPGARFVGHLRLDVDTLVYAVGLMLMGVHISIFAVCAKVFGIGEGLLPPDKNFDRWFRYITLETGVLAGAAMLLGGLGSAAYAFALWLRVGLGVLDAEHMLRITLPSAVLLLLGVEAIFASFFLSLMGTARQQATPPDPSD